MYKESEIADHMRSLKDWIEYEKREYYSREPKPRMDFEEENLIWAVQEYLGIAGEFSEEDKEYLIQSGHEELLSLEDEDNENY